MEPTTAELTEACYELKSEVRAKERDVERLRAELEKARERYAALLEALKALSMRHESWEQGCGPCVCQPHIDARAVLATEVKP